MRDVGRGSPPKIVPNYTKTLTSALGSEIQSVGKPFREATQA